MAWPCGLFLTFAVQKIIRQNKPLAYITCFILVPVSAILVTTGGLLGFIGMLLNAAVASLPAWIIVGVMFLIRKYRAHKLKLSNGEDNRPN